MLCLLKLDVTGAFYYHPLFWLVFLWGIYLLFVRRRHRLPPKVELTVLLVTVLLFLGVYAFRLATGTLV